MPKLNGVLETVLYVEELERADVFYREIFGLTCIHSDFRMRGYDVSGHSMLVLFPQGGSLHPIETPGGTIPPHDGSGPAHVAFSIDADALSGWENHPAASNVTIEERTHWPRGGTSIYFRHPDGHLLKLATSGLWKGD